jgi:CheY-like chemotaxis protein
MADRNDRSDVSLRRLVTFGSACGQMSAIREANAYGKYVQPHNTATVEVLILGDLIVRKNGEDISGLTTALAETVTLIAAHCGPVLRRKLRSAHSDDVPEDGFSKRISRLRELGVPIVTGGSRGATTYRLDSATCQVDAVRFVQGVEAGHDIDDLLRLWRSPAPPAVLGSAAVRKAVDRLIGRISELPEADQAALTDLPRFAALFPDDQELDKIRPSGPRSRPWLLVVEDDAEVMDEICGWLETAYRLKRLTGIDEWRKFRAEKDELALIQGALVDLSLTPDGGDQRGLEIVRHLRDNTEIPTALVTANLLERNELGRNDRMDELRLVDILNKQSRNWYESLEATAELLVGTGVVERRRRMETWLRWTYRELRRETHDAAPDSVAARRRKTCHDQYIAALSLVLAEDVDAAQQAVDRFCATWRTSG